MTSRDAEFRSGVAYALSAYGLWGVFPLYFRAIRDVEPFELVVQRVLWSAAFLGLLLAARRNFSWLRRVFAARILASFVVSGFVLGLNWLIFIWAVDVGRVVDASLGYFINPLVSVLLGVLLLGERLRRAQWFAVLLAALGVVWLTIASGHLPWIGIGLAISFGLYGLLRKTASLGALEGLALETLLLLPLALAYLASEAVHARSAFVEASAPLKFLIVLLGPVTAVPLLLFAAGARRIPLSFLGLLQYIAPSLQLVIGVFVFGEAFRIEKLVGFALIWAALAVYSLESYWLHRSLAAASDPKRSM